MSAVGQFHDGLSEVRLSPRPLTAGSLSSVICMLIHLEIILLELGLVASACNPSPQESGTSVSPYLKHIKSSNSGREKSLLVE